MNKWRVELRIVGPVTVDGHYRGSHAKGQKISDPFFSDVEISSPGGSGLRTVNTASAKTQQSAEQVSEVFISQMLNWLCVELDLPLAISGSEIEARGVLRERTNRVVDSQALSRAFDLAHEYRTSRPYFLRALGLYRKATITSNPLDAFLGYWNSIEVCVSRHKNIDQRHDRFPRRELNGSKNQTWWAFKELWGEQRDWPIEESRSKSWIDDMNDQRLSVAHGLVPVTAESIPKMSELVLPLRQVAHRFLKDWDAVMPGRWLTQHDDMSDMAS